MKIIKMLAASIALTAIAITGFAQEEEEKPDVFTYATYYNCGGGPLGVADEIIAEDYDRLDGLVDDGTIDHWGWMAHHTGGPWQRIFYYQAGSLDALLDASDAVQGNDDDGDDEDDGDAADDDDRPAFGSICNRHDDYIWQVENGMGSDARGEAGFSVYHSCDINREERADEIVAEHVAPILNKMVEDGKLTSWGWQSHVVGGRFRKLQTMTGVDHKSLIAARNEAITAVYDGDSAAGDEFSEICGPHVDYMWDIVHEK
jgi:hypothetical protein